MQSFLVLETRIRTRMVTNSIKFDVPKWRTSIKFDVPKNYLWVKIHFMILGVAALKVVIVQKEHSKMIKMNVLRKLNALVTITTWYTHMELWEKKNVTIGKLLLLLTFVFKIDDLWSSCDRHMI